MQLSGAPTAVIEIAAEPSSNFWLWIAGEVEKGEVSDLAVRKVPLGREVDMKTTAGFTFKYFYCIA